MVHDFFTHWGTLLLIDDGFIHGTTGEITALYLCDGLSFYWLCTLPGGTSSHSGGFEERDTMDAANN